MTTEAQRDEWRGLTEKATAGPWDSGGGWIWERTHHAVGDPEAPDTRIGSVRNLAGAGEADAAFIAAARTAVPALLDENERLREALRALVHICEASHVYEDAKETVGGIVANARALLEVE